MCTTWVTYHDICFYGLKSCVDRVSNSEILGFYTVESSGDVLAVPLLHPDICWPGHSQDVLKEPNGQNPKEDKLIKMREFRKAIIAKYIPNKGYKPNPGRTQTLGSLLCVGTDLNTDGLTLYKRMTSVYSPNLKSVWHFLIAGVCHGMGHTGITV